MLSLEDATSATSSKAEVDSSDESEESSEYESSSESEEDEELGDSEEEELVFEEDQDEEVDVEQEDSAEIYRDDGMSIQSSPAKASAEEEQRTEEGDVVEDLTPSTVEAVSAVGDGHLDTVAVCKSELEHDTAGEVVPEKPVEDETEMDIEKAPSPSNQGAAYESVWLYHSIMGYGKLLNIFQF